MSDSAIRLVCFDLNGTLIKENSWEKLNLAMGVTQQEDLRLLNLYREKKISYQEGLNLLLPMYKRHGKFTKANVLHAIFQYTYLDGAKEIIEYLQKKNYLVALLSGSFDLLVERVAKELGISLWGANNRFIFNDNPTIECCNNDDIFKKEKLIELCRTIGIEMNQCACIGDSENDRMIFQLTGRGIAISGSPIEKDAWKVVKKLDELETIL